MKQEHKKYALALLVISLCVVIGTLGAARLIECTYWENGVEFDDFDCYKFFEQKVEPFFWSFLPLLPITLILFFLRREVFLAWAKFAAVGFPLMLGLMLYAFNVGQTTGGWVGGPTESELASFTLPPLFLIISLAIIGVKSYKLRKEAR